LRSESTNFLAEHFGVKFVLDRELETFDEYLAKIDAVTAEEVKQVAIDLFQSKKFNLQIIGPLENTDEFKLLLK